MGFEPLRTDEKLSAPVKPPRDMDTLMLFGCSGFVLSALGGYALAVWPWFAFLTAERLASLALCAATGLAPAAIAGVLLTRRFGLAAACGFVGGAVATAIFLHLRLQQVFVAALAEQAPRPEYPSSLVYIVPIAWILAAVLLAMVFLPKEPPETT